VTYCAEPVLFHFISKRSKASNLDNLQSQIIQTCQKIIIPWKLAAIFHQSIHDEASNRSAQIQSLHSKAYSRPYILDPREPLISPPPASHHCGKHQLPRAIWSYQPLEYQEEWAWFAKNPQFLSKVVCHHLLKFWYSTRKASPLDPIIVAAYQAPQKPSTSLLTSTTSPSLNSTPKFWTQIQKVNN